MRFNNLALTMHPEILGAPLKAQKHHDATISLTCAIVSTPLPVRFQ